MWIVGGLTGAAVAAAMVAGAAGFIAGSMKPATGRPISSSPAPARVADPPSRGPTPAVIPTSFVTAQELVDTLAEQGLPCGAPTYVPNPSLATSLIDCGPTIVVGVYATHSDALGAYQILESAARASGALQAHMAIGYNWTVSADDAAYAKQVAIKFGVSYFATD